MFVEEGTDMEKVDASGVSHWIRRSHLAITTADGFEGRGTTGFSVLRGGDNFVGVQHQEVLMFNPETGEKFKLHRNSAQVNDMNGTWHNARNEVSTCMGQS